MSGKPKRKIYAIAKGRRTGLFDSWDEAKVQIQGVNSIHKSFFKREAAIDFLKQHGIVVNDDPSPDLNDENQISELGSRGCFNSENLDSSQDSSSDNEEIDDVETTTTQHETQSDYLNEIKVLGTTIFQMKDMLTTLLHKVTDQAKQIAELKESQDSFMQISRANNEQRQAQTTTMNLNAGFRDGSEPSWQQAQNQQIFQESPAMIFDPVNESHSPYYGSAPETSEFQPSRGRRNSPRRNSSRRESIKPSMSNPVVLIGDSIIKHIDPQKLSQRPVRKFTYPGKTADEIAECVNTINIDDPSHVVIHAGTNNLPTESAEACSSKIQSLVGKVTSKFPNAKVAVSGLTYREDVDINSKRSEVNEVLKQSAEDGGYTFIEHSNIDNTGLNGSKLHLNAKGTALLATQIIRFLRKDSSQNKKHRQDFHISSVQDLGHLLLNLGRARPWKPRRNYRQ